ncbi:hypothetical protein ACFXA0_25645 [Streptomyces cyaneofuscatus]|uniref:hypothetical protein n=1 Tax=Streptomyces cyaneofuscatus TaxID=66883 RepID=UPI00367D6F73
MELLIFGKGDDLDEDGADTNIAGAATGFCRLQLDPESVGRPHEREPGLRLGMQKLGQGDVAACVRLTEAMPGTAASSR